MELRAGDVIKRTVTFDGAEWKAISTEFDLFEHTRESMADIHLAMIKSLERDRLRLWDVVARKFGYRDYRHFVDKNFHSKLLVNMETQSVHLIHRDDPEFDPPSKK